MNELSIYFIKVNIALAIFYLVYRLLFNRDTHWNARRIYLLSATFISFIFPFIPVAEWLSRQESVQVFISEYIQLQDIEIAMQTPSTFDLQNTLWIVYGLIAGVFLLRMIMQLFSVFRWRLKGKKQYLNGTKVIVLNENICPFSFFGLIFINPELHDENEQNEILAHERTHVCQLHSIDMMIGELLSVLCWINPATWLLRREIRQNLEFLADNRVLSSGYDSKNYQYHLLRLTSEKPTIKLVNNFNVLPLKKRIVMMNKEKTPKTGLLKYSVIVPLALVLILGSNAQTLMASAQEPMKSTKIEIKKIVISNENEEAYENVEVLPEFPGGIEGLMKYIKDNLKYPADAIENQIEGRVVVKFIINKIGEVADMEVLHSLHPSCDDEAIRVIRAMPKWTPGKQDGKDVAVFFTLPIAYKLNDDKTKDDEMKKITIVNKKTQKMDGDEAKVVATKKITVLDKKPLFVLDGKVLEDDFDINTIEVDNIESITVLKEETATAVYGEKGKNGVLLITMKKK